MNDANSNRIGVISIVVRDRAMAARVNEILGRHGDVIHGRLGIPYSERGVSIVVVVVDTDQSTIGAIGGALGNIPGVTLRSTILT